MVTPEKLGKLAGQRCSSKAWIYGMREENTNRNAGVIGLKTQEIRGLGSGVNNGQTERECEEMCWLH